jgi:hypothetical protein
MKENVFRNTCEAEDVLCNIWSEVSLNDPESGFHEWMRHLKHMFLNKPSRIFISHPGMVRGDCLPSLDELQGI